MKRLRRWWPGLALAAMLVALFPDVFVRGWVISANDILYQHPLFNEQAPPGFQRPHNPLLADQPNKFYSDRRFLREQVRQGVWPWWMPNILCGQSFMLNLPTQAFHPAQLLVWALPQTIGETVYALLKLLAAGLGTFLFLRTRAVAGVTALAGGLSFMACSYNIVWLNHPHSGVAPMLPWCLWVVECGFQRRLRPAATLLAGGAIFYLLLAGAHPNTIIVSLFLVGLYTVYRLLSGSPSEGWGMRVLALLQVGGSLGLGLLLSGIFLVPFAMARMSSDFYFGDRIGVASLAVPLPLREYVGPLLLPLAGGSPLTGDDRHIYNFNENAMFVGVVSLVPQLLALPWLLRRRDSLFLFGVTSIVVLSLQDVTPVAYVVRHIPLLRDNHLQRISLLLQFALAAGGGIAWHVLALRPADRRHRILFGAAAACLIAGGLGVTWRVHSARGYGWFALALVGGAVAAAALPWLSRPELRTRLLTGVCLLLSLELWAAQGGYNGTLPRDVAEVAAPPLVRQLRDERANGWYRIAAMNRSILPPNTSAWFGLDDIRGYDVPISRRYIDFLRHGVYGGTWAFEAMCCDLGVIDDGRRRLLQVMGVRHLLFSDRNVTHARELPGALPHVFWADNLRPSTSDLPRDVEVLRRGGMVADLPAWRAPRDGRGPLHERPVSVNAVAVDADVTEPGVLVLNEMPIEGWRVRVDGKPAAVVPVNIIQTGVWLETGRHSVEFYFRPRGVRLGGIMSFCGLAAMFALVVGVWKRPTPAGVGEAGTRRNLRGNEPGPVTRPPNGNVGLAVAVEIAGRR